MRRVWSHAHRGTPKREDFSEYAEGGGNLQTWLSGQKAPEEGNLRNVKIDFVKVNLERVIHIY